VGSMRDCVGRRVASDEGRGFRSGVDHYSLIMFF